MTAEQSKNILIISPHMDDEALGLGGTIVRHVECKDKVSVIFVAGRVYNHIHDESINQEEQRAAENARSILQYDKAIYLNLSDERLDESIQRMLIPLEKILDEMNPHIVYIPFYGDNNQDHRAVFNAARVLLRPSANPNIKKVLMYETPSSTEQSPPIVSQVFMPNYYVNIEDAMDVKLEAVNCYVREKRDFPHPRSKEGVTILAKKRGIEVGFKAAESFMILRDKWDT